MSNVEDSVVSDNASHRVPVKNELLCFVREKCNVVALDHLVKICVDFYRVEEIMKAKAELDNVLEYRLPRRQGPDKGRSTLEDIIKTCLDPTVTLPVFYAVELNRVPPVDARHCDVTAILIELQSLRAEVRDIGCLRQEIELLKEELTRIKDNKTSFNRINNADQVVTIAGTASGESAESNGAQVGPSTFVQVAQELQRMGMAAAPRTVTKTVKKPVVGTLASSRLKSVQTYRNVDIFVSRLSPHTTEVELVNCINEMNSTVKVHEVVCEKLQSRHEHLYKSYHLSVRVESQHMKSAIDTFMSADVWPTGVLVRRYFKPRNGRE